MSPMGGIAGLGIALGGSVEYQMGNDPHFHGNYHVATIYQHKTLAEIATMINKHLIKLEEITKYQAWICRESHFDQESHNSSLGELEKAWCDNNQGPDGDGLCQLPSYIAKDTSES